MRKFFAIFVMLLTVLSATVGCSIQYTDESQETKVDLNCKRQYMIIGEQYLLIASVGSGVADLAWSSDNVAVAQVDNGLIKAVGVGECMIRAANSMSTALCKIVVCNSMVSPLFDSTSIGYGRERFTDIQTAANLGGSIIIMQGDYPEHLNLPIKVKLFAVGKVKVLSIFGEEFSAEGISICANTAPKVGNALVYAIKEMELKKCDMVLSTGLSAELLTGGSGVGISQQGKKLNVIDCRISNFAQGINLYKFSGETKIVANTLNNCLVGIAVDIRPEDNKLKDFAASGIIKNNIFVDNFQDSIFLFGGDRYDGHLDFYDFSKLTPKPSVD